MIIVKTMEGLGNQMFQYAIGRYLADKNNTTLKLDLSSYDKKYDNITPREYSLKYFNIVKNIAINNETKKMQKYKQKNGRRYFFYNLFFSNSSIYIKEKHFNFDKNILNSSNNIYLDGWWQSEKYFKNIENVIREEFTLKNKLNYSLQKITKKIKSLNSIALHIRRGDYANNPKTNLLYGLCPMEYYDQAIKKMANKVKNPVFFIFSDDINWAKNNLKTNFPAAFINGNKDYEDLILMSLCKHNIIANSSFSWWGAWLNKNPDKIVIAPKKWFNNPKINIEDLIPKLWIQI